MNRQNLEISYSPKPIQCVLSSPEGTTKGKNPKNTAPTPALIFTHGAGGTLSSDAIANFSSGFALRAPILCFQGNMNLKSRVKMYNSVIEDQSLSVSLGGRSMGARAAVMAATDATERLVLVSYPLHAGKETRDEILLELAPAIKVIFVVGSRDSMCELGQLEEVRKKMKSKTWRVMVEEADHGMTMKPNKATEAVGKKTGEVVAQWMDECNEKMTEGRIFWNGEEERAEWSGWSVESEEAAAPPPNKESSGQDAEDAITARREHGSRGSKSKRSRAAPDEEVVSGRTRKRLKR